MAPAPHLEGRVPAPLACKHHEVLHQRAEQPLACRMSQPPEADGHDREEQTFAGGTTKTWVFCRSSHNRILKPADPGGPASVTPQHLPQHCALRGKISGSTSAPRPAPMPRRTLVPPVGQNATG